MKTLLGFCFVGLLGYGQLASSFTVYRPDGIVEVQQTSYGFNVIDLRKNQVTSVSRTGTGYVIVPQGEAPTFIKMNPGDEPLEKEILLPSIIDDDLID